MYGTRRVNCTTWYGENFDLTFVVSDVSRAIVAVGDLLDQGFVPDFREPAGLVRSGRRLPLVMAGALYYLPVHIERASSKQMSNVDNCATVYVNALVDNPIKLYEYCCSEDSLLTQWFRAHGHEAE
eukprot:4204313-Heterocapsa_arctica.AAC.1